MKKVIAYLILIMFLIIPIKTYASDTAVEVMVEGKVNKGKDINILVNVKNVQNFYAASVDYTYDKDLLKVSSIKAGAFISKYSDEIMEIGGDTAKNGNTATYSFTFLGDKTGLEGSGNLVIIQATVLKDDELSIDKDSIKIKLVQRTGDSMQNYEYAFIGYNVSESPTPKVEEDSTIEVNNTVENNKTNEDDTTRNDNKVEDNKAINEKSKNQLDNSKKPIVKNELGSGAQKQDNKSNNNSNLNKENSDNKNEKSNDLISNKDSIADKKENKINLKFTYLLITVLITSGIGIVYYLYKKKTGKKMTK